MLLGCDSTAQAEVLGLPLYDWQAREEPKEQSVPDCTCIGGYAQWEHHRL
jgi:hypothetical protein